MLLVEGKQDALSSCLCKRGGGMKESEFDEISETSIDVDLDCVQVRLG